MLGVGSDVDGDGGGVFGVRNGAAKVKELTRSWEASLGWTGGGRSCWLGGW